MMNGGFHLQKSAGKLSNQWGHLRHLRRIIWIMTVKVIQVNEHFHQYYQKRIAEGLIYKKAVLATAHKLIRVIFAMLSNKTRYNVKAAV